MPNPFRRRKRAAATRQLMAVCLVGSGIEQVYAIIGQGADLAATDANGNTPLHLAMTAADAPGDAKHWAVVIALVHSHADINATNHQGRAVLHLILEYLTAKCLSGYMDCVEFLVEHGADLGLRDQAGRAPADWITEHPGLFTPALVAQAAAARMQRLHGAMPEAPRTSAPRL